MTRKEIIYELYNLSFADDVPMRYKPIITEMISTIMDAPAIEAEPVRRGKWKAWYLGNTKYSYTCNLCGSHTPNEKTPYCAYCGAKMEEQYD